MTNMKFIKDEDRDELVTSIDRLLTKINGTSPLDDADMQSFITDMLVVAENSVGLGIALAMNNTEEVAYYSEMVQTASNAAKLSAETIDERSMKIIGGRIQEWILDFTTHIEDHLK